MKRAVIAIWYSACIVATSIALPQFLSRWEVSYAPVLTNQSISDLWMEPGRDKLCWSWTFTKIRRAAPVGFRYYLTAANIEDMPVVLLRDGPVTASERPLGAYTDRFCVVLPEGVGPKVELHGYGEYTVTHDLWTVRQPLPMVTWP